MQAEEALRQSEAQFRATADALPGLLFVTSSEGRNRYVNSGYCAYAACAAGELLDFGYRKLLQPDDAERSWRLWRETVKKGEPLSAEYRLRRHDGEYRWHLVRALPVRGADGEIEYWVGTATDIHDRRGLEDTLFRLNSELEARVREAVRERENALEKLAHSQKLEALGQLAGGIAHDFNNVLQAIESAAELIERRADNPGQVRSFAQLASQASKRGSAVTQRLLAFARRADLRAEAIEAAELLSNMKEILSHTLGAAIEVGVRAARELPPFVADRNQLDTVLVNLATTPATPCQAAGCCPCQLTWKSYQIGRAQRGRLKPAAYVRLSVSDTGPGMAPEVLARACEPFFTTKLPGSGSGLGLAMARGFAEQSGGALAIESPLEKGLTVSLWFPVAENKATKPEGSSVLDRLRRGLP
jgi:PAS domain S-box-containing protein